MNKKLKIIKIGGQLIDDQQKLDSVLKQFSALDGPKILVHGGGKLASLISSQMGIEPKMVNGRRITDSESLKMVQMTYAGIINTNIVAGLQALKCNAVGQNGADGNSILAVKRPVTKIDYGFVGEIIKVNTIFLTQFLQSNIVPVFCALTHDGNGQMLNTNADTITAELGIALSKEFEQVDLIFCFEKKGVLQNRKDDDSVIPLINAESYLKLLSEKTIADGMIPKIDNAFDALTRGVKNVFIVRYDQLYRSSGKKQAGTRIAL